MTDQHRLLGHLAIHRRVPKSELEANFGADVVAGALETGLIHADFFGATDITERGMRQFNYAPLERQVAQKEPPPSYPDLEQAAEVASPEPESAEQDSVAEEEVMPRRKGGLSLYEKLIGVFQNTSRPLTAGELARAIRYNSTAGVRFTLTQMVTAGEIVSQKTGPHPKAAKLYGFPSVFSREGTPSVVSQNEEWQSLEGDSTEAVEIPVASASVWGEPVRLEARTLPVRGVDSELEGMNAALQALEPLTDAGRMRAVDWLIKRFDITEYYEEKR